MSDIPILDGQIIQTKYAMFNTWVSTNAVIPVDDSIPQWSEGTLCPQLDITITPYFADSRICLSLEFAAGSSGAASWIVGAIFRGNGPDAILARAVYSTGVNFSTMLTICGHDLPGPGTHTYRVRVGTASGNAGFYWNGISANHLFSTAQAGTIFTVQEVRNMT